MLKANAIFPLWVMVVLSGCGEKPNQSAQEKNKTNVVPTDCKFVQPTYGPFTDTVFTAYNAKYRLLIETRTDINPELSTIKLIENGHDTIFNKIISIDSFETALGSHHVEYGTIRYADLKTYPLMETSYLGLRGHDLFFQLKFSLDTITHQYLKFQLNYSKQRAGKLFMNAVGSKSFLSWK